MAQQNSPLDQDRYCCSICLELLRDPGTLPCGHSYCLGCITDYWNNAAVRGVYSCPQCRQTFTPRPSLVKNTVLADVMEELKRIQLQDATPDGCYAGPGDVGCDVCTGRKMKAIMSCLGCLASFCEEHLQSHHQLAGLRRHRLVEPTTDLQENICPHHNEVIKMFCRQHQQGICCLCTVAEHRGHDNISVETERKERQKDLSRHQKTTQTRIQKVEEDLKFLQQEIDSINNSANGVLSNIDMIFAEMRSEVKEKVRTKQNSAVSRIQDLQKNAEQEITAMKKTVDDLDNLSRTQSDISFLKKYPHSFHLKKYTVLPSRDADPMQYLKNVTVGLAKMTDKLNVFLKDNISQISLEAAQMDVFCSHQPQSQTRADFLKYSCEISFDPNTKTKSLSLSDGNKRVTLSKQSQTEVTVGNCLSKESVTGRQYWEVKWTGRYFSTAVGYRDSSWNHKGFGNDDKSWALSICQIGIEFEHNKIITKIPGPSPSRVGVYLDHRAGILCFYNISDKMTLLHKVQTTFTQPLYAGIWLYERPGVSAEFCYPLQERVYM